MKQATSGDNFAAKLEEEACDNVTAIDRKHHHEVKALRNDIMGAWGLMELRTRSLDRKLYSATYVVDETQLRAL